MEERLKMLEDEDATTVFMNRIFFSGLTNPLVEWYGGDFPLILTVLEKLSPEQIHANYLRNGKEFTSKSKNFQTFLSGRMGL
jgi:hypothetical protein